MKAVEDTSIFATGVEGTMSICRKRLWVFVWLSCLITVLIVSIIIVIKLGMYAVPQVDDFRYGSLTKHIWDTTHNFSQVIRKALAVVEQTYFDWQGTYSAIFLMALQPGIFGTEYYSISTPFILFSLLLGIYFFIGMLVKYVLHGNTAEWLGISTVICISCINYVPFPVEAFYWYNGAVYYTFYFALELVLFALFILYWNSKGASRTLSAIIICVLCPFIAGGSYAVALLSSVLLFLLLIYAVVKKERQPIVCVGLLLMIGCLLISILAPGNNNHTQMSMSGVKAVAIAVLRAVEFSILFIVKWFQTPVLMLAAITGILSWGMVDRVDFRFKYPLLLFIASVLIIAIGFTPTLYTIERVGPDRLIDMQFYLFITLLSFNVYYLTGWLKKQVFKDIDTRLFHISVLTKRLLPIALAGVFVLNCIPNSSKSLTRRAVAAMEDGTAQEYYSEVSTMLETCENAPVGADLLFPELSSRPELLCLYWSFRGDSDVMEFIADYYSLNSFNMR